MTTQQYKAMIEAMETAGWTPLRDVFHYVYGWTCLPSRKILSRADVERHWRLYGTAPAPF